MKQYTNRFRFGGLSLFFVFLAACLMASLPALAETSRGLRSDNDDWGVAWIDYLLRGMALPSSLSRSFTHLDSLTLGLRQILESYSLAMLVLAVIVLFYHIVAIVVETAHTGVVLGGRMNPIWAPIRLVFAIGLLVPVSGGLGSGQYIVIKIAEQGSRLASNAWRDVLENASADLSGLVAPHMPPLGNLVTAATEMEMCHLIYEQLYNPVQNDAILHVAGHINDAVKIPANRLASETWRYSNSLNANAPLCGEFVFSGTRPHSLLAASEGDETARIAADLDSFAKTRMTSLMVDARGMALREVPALTGDVSSLQGDVHKDLSLAETSLRNDLNARIHSGLSVETRLLTPVLTQSSEGGWIAAALFIPELARSQQSYGELLTTALPTAQEPTFAHQALAQQLLVNTFKTQLWFQNQNSNEAEKLAAFYNQISRSVAAIHGWLYNSQLVDNDFTVASSFDLHDLINDATTPETTLSLFAHALDSAAVEQGIWGVSSGSTDTGYPFSGVSSGTPYSSMAMLSEFGRRQYQLGLYLTGLAGEAITLPHASAPAVFAGLGGVSFILGALLLIFVVPFLVFFRFTMAVLTWLLTVVEAVAAMPIIALAHMTPTGSGLSGGLARQAYVLGLALWARPVLTLLGLVAGMIFFSFSLSFLCLALTPFAHLSSTSNSGLLITSNVALVLLFDVMAYALANVAFKGITLFPEQALRWISGFVLTDNDATATPPSSPSGLPQLSGFPAMMTDWIGSHVGKDLRSNAKKHQDKSGAARTNNANFASGSGNDTPNMKLQKALMPPVPEPPRGSATTDEGKPLGQPLRSNPLREKANPFAAPKATATEAQKPAKTAAPPLKPYRAVPIKECGEALVPIPRDAFAFFAPHAYVAAGAPYGDVSPWMLRESVLEALLKAQRLLQQMRPGWKIMLFDAYRPNRVQAYMVEREISIQAKAMGFNAKNLSSSEREAVEAKVYRVWGIPSTDPATPPPHSTGAAVDCTLQDDTGNAVNMGSPIDENSDRSLPDFFSAAQDAAGVQAHRNRTLLNDIMRAEGFHRLADEWWHFSHGDQCAVWSEREKSPKAVAVFGRADLIG